LEKALSWRHVSAGGKRDQLPVLMRANAVPRERVWRAPRERRGMEDGDAEWTEASMKVGWAAPRMVTAWVRRAARDGVGRTPVSRSSTVESQWPV
jgi:hypothetical protein